MTPQEYFSQTEQAVTQLFDSLRFYLDLLKEIDPPMFSTSANGIAGAQEWDEWYKKNQKSIEAAMERQRKYLGYVISKATICGSILQIAFMGIKMFSLNKTVPPECAEILSGQPEAVKFCVGRLIRGLPLGLIIYAGRNQYNHMDEGKYHRLTEQIFDRLATLKTNAGKEVKDPAFDLTNPNLSYELAANILAIIRWENYDKYLTDMKNMLLGP